MIARWRRQVGINVNALTEEGKKALSANETEGFVKFLKPVAGNLGNISSDMVPPDLFRVMGIMQDNLQETLQVSGLRMGSAAGEKTLGQDQLVEMGNQLGMSGMEDKVREFVRSQARKLAQLRKQFSTGPSLVPIVGTEIINPLTGKLITDEWLEFGTPENPVTLRQVIAGEYDVEVDIKSAQKPNEAVMMKLFENMMAIIPVMEQKLTEVGQKFDWSKLSKIWLGLYKEFIPNVDSVVVNMDEREIQSQQEAQAKQQRTQEEMIRTEVQKVVSEAMKNFSQADKNKAEALKTEKETATEVGVDAGQ